MSELYHRIIADPRTRRYGLPLLAAVVGFEALAVVNRWLSQRALNNGVSDATWDWSKELVVITGGNSGIGAATVRELASRKIKVVILDRTKPSEALPQGVHAYQVDITDQAAVHEAASRIRAEHGAPTVIINNAGIGSHTVLLDKPMDAIRKVFDVNVFAPLHIIKEFVPDMVAHDHGHIVNIASMASFVTRAANTDYAASKAAILALHEGLALEIALWNGAKRIRTTVVHPAWINTPLIQDLASTNHFTQTTIGPEIVARSVVKQLLSGNSGQLFVPPSFAIGTHIRGLPHWFQRKLGVDQSRACKEASDIAMERDKNNASSK